MNFSTPLSNWRFAVFSISLLFSACTSLPSDKGIGGIVTQPKPSPSPVTQSPYGSQILSSYSGSYALLIGESKYTHGWSRLGSIPDELQDVETVLQAQGFQIEKSLNLTARQLKNRFEKFINDYGFKENNRLLFFYSGHGHTHRKRGYLVPTDAPNPHFDEEGFLQKAVTMNEILAMARKMYAKHALFLFDSCFSGTVFQAKGDLPEVPRQISKMAKLPVRQFITAGSAEQTVPAKSVFTPAFVDALRYGLGDLYKDGYVTGEELGLYLKNKVPQHTDQTPQYGKIRDYDLSRGDFVFAVKGYQPDRNQDYIAQAESTNQQQAQIIAAQQAELKRLRREKEIAEQQAQADRRARKQAQIAAQQAELKRLRREKEIAERQAQADRSARIEAERRAQEARRKQPRPQTGRYTDNGDGTVTDNRSGLIWLKKANCFGAQDWETAMQSAANLAHGQCGLRDGSKAGMWRLPTKEEWKAMIDKKYVDKQNWNQPAISNAAGTGPWKEGGVFLGVQAFKYWSAAINTSNAWCVILQSGGQVCRSHKMYNYYVWPVRGGV